MESSQTWAIDVASNLTSPSIETKEMSYHDQRAVLRAMSSLSFVLASHQCNPSVSMTALQNHPGRKPILEHPLWNQHSSQSAALQAIVIILPSTRNDTWAMRNVSLISKATEPKTAKTKTEASSCRASDVEGRYRLTLQATIPTFQFSEASLLTLNMHILLSEKRSPCRSGR